MTAKGGSHLMHRGSGPSILTVIIEDRVPSTAKLLHVSVLFRLTAENRCTLPIFKWGRPSTCLAVWGSLLNPLLLVTYENVNKMSIWSCQYFHFWISVHVTRQCTGCVVFHWCHSSPKLLHVRWWRVLRHLNRPELIICEHLTKPVMIIRIIVVQEI